MRVTKHHLGIRFEVWKSQQSWFWLVENTNRNGMIGAAATQSAAIDDARSSIEEIAKSDARREWECTLGNSRDISLPFATRPHKENLMITITAYDWVPDFAKGLVRDLRVRWALEEAGLEYRVRLVTHEEKLPPSYRALQPFSQVPAYQDDDVALFESGAILLHIGRKSAALLPTDQTGQARATAWVFAALNSIEPFIMGLIDVDLFSREEPWAPQSRPHWEAMVKKRLSDLAERLRGRDWLEDRFTVGDLMTATVLRTLRHTELVTSDPTLAMYLARCEERPAFRKALADQMASFK